MSNEEKPPEAPQAPQSDLDHDPDAGSESGATGSESESDPGSDDVEPDAPVEAKAGEVIGFEDLGLSEDALKTIRAAGYLVPTPIQEQAIPQILDYRDVIGSAQTGTGKTATFALPICDHLAGRGGTLAVVLAPTREIAQQTFDAFETFGKPRGIKACVLIGGVDMKPQLELLKTYPQVIVATPGRLVDHMERGTIWLEYVEVLVLDEADRMLDMGFIPQINRIVAEIPADGRQTLLFSATMPPPIEKLCRAMMHDPVRVSVGKPMAAASTVDHDLWVCDPGKKMSALRRILREELGTVIVFSRSKKGVVELWQSLHSAEFYDATMIHSDRTQEQRMQALADFKGGKSRVLIATDVAARGLDIANVQRVVNFDMPFVPEDYIHRIGRSGRANAKGRATTLFTRLDKKLLHDIEKLLGKPIPVTRDLTSGDQGGGGGGDRPRHGDREGGRGGGGRGRRGGGGGGERHAGDSGRSSAPADPNYVPKLPIPNLPNGQPAIPPTDRSAAPPREHVAAAHNPGAGSEGQATGPGGAAAGPDGPRKRRRRRGGRGRKRGGPGGGPDGGGGSGGSGGGGQAPSGGDAGPTS